jgi:hypothetical protein
MECRFPQAEGVLNTVSIGKKWVVWAVIALVAVQALQIAFVVHRESLTWDEDDHMFAGYMMWKTGDYGLNPEHPPLVKLLATLPLLGENLWVPQLQNRDFKTEAYMDGRDWLARNDGASQRLVFRMRLAAGLLALALSLLVFFAAREWFGTPAALDRADAGRLSIPTCWLTPRWSPPILASRSSFWPAFTPSIAT